MERRWENFCDCRDPGEERKGEKVVENTRSMVRKEASENVEKSGRRQKERHGGNLIELSFITEFDLIIRWRWDRVQRVLRVRVKFDINHGF